MRVVTKYLFSCGVPVVEDIFCVVAVVPSG